jgi:hypothetical protein
MMVLRRIGIAGALLLLWAVLAAGAQPVVQPDMQPDMSVDMPAEVSAGGGDAPGERRYRLTVVPGEHYSHVKWFFIIPVRLQPQLALWIEDAAGNLVETLYLSRKAASGERGGGAKERPEALPIFTHRFPPAERAGLDALSSATPEAAEQERLSWEFALPGKGEYRMYAEVNSSFDYNAAYPRERSGVNGQPSVLYRASLGPDTGAITLRPAGHGSLDGADGRLRRDLSGCREALRILAELKLEPLR